MTRDQQIEVIRQKCIEANPEIMELKFGCKIQDMVMDEMIEGEDLFTFIGVSEDSRDFLLWNNMSGETVKYAQELVRGSDMFILGRPIRLADVLLTMNGKGKGLTDNWFINTRGHFYKQTMLLPATALPEIWDLFKDSLTDQSDETISFLYNLLK